MVSTYYLGKREISDEVGKGRQRQCYLQQIDYVKQCAYSKMVVIRMSFFLHKKDDFLSQRWRPCHPPSKLRIWQKIEMKV